MIVAVVVSGSSVGDNYNDGDDSESDFNGDEMATLVMMTAKMIVITRGSESSGGDDCERS